MTHKTIDGWTRRRAGWGLGGLTVGLLDAASGQTAAAKKKKKRCKKPPICPNDCLLLFTEPGGSRICGEAATVLGAPACTLCATRSDCGGNAPHCLNSVENRSTGAVSFFTNVCGSYPLGVCGTVTACVT